MPIPTPQGDEAVIFIRDEQAAASGSSAHFTKVVRQRATIQLRDLTDEFGVSAILECDEKGAPLPRTLVKTNPEEPLHRGHHYLVRKRGPANHAAPVRREGGNAVTFRDKLVIKEYSIVSDGDSLRGASAASADMSADSHVSSCGEDLRCGAAPTRTFPTIPGDVTRGEGDDEEEAYVFCGPFTHKDDSTGALTFVTLEYLQQLADNNRAAEVSRSRVEESEHREALKEISEAENLLRRFASPAATSDTCCTV